MLDKSFVINIEKSHKFFLCGTFAFAIACAYIICFVLEEVWHITVFPMEVALIIFLIPYFYLLYKWQRHLPDTQTLEVMLTPEFVVLAKGQSKRKIYYSEILAVEKNMVISSKEHPEKGYYRVKIKCKGRNYMIYSTQDEYNRHLDFEDTELSKVYFEFETRGIKCC